MKVLCNIGHGANSFMKRAWQQVFEYCGHEFHYWNPDEDDADKAFSIEPDIFIGTTYDFYRAQLRNIKSRPNMKVCMVASDWGPLTEKMDLQKYQIVYANTKEIKLIEELKKETGKPDFVFIHYDKSAIEATHAYWRDKLGISIDAVTQCADLFDYYDSTYTEYFSSDIAFVGGYWGYKAQNLDKYLVSLCKRYGKYKIKIYGNQPWPVPQYAGLAPTKQVKNIFRSSLVCPNISEPHAEKYGVELMERPFKVLSSGGFCISSRNKAMETIFLDIIPMFDNEFEFFDMVEYFVKNPEKRDVYIKNGQDRVLCKHTGFHRVGQILYNLGFENEFQQCEQKYEEFLNAA